MHQMHSPTLTLSLILNIIVNTFFCMFHRLLTLGLQGSEAITWAKALQPENVLSRILWVVENTLNPQLIEKVAAIFSD